MLNLSPLKPLDQIFIDNLFTLPFIFALAAVGFVSTEKNEFDELIFIVHKTVTFTREVGIFPRFYGPS